MPLYEFVCEVCGERFEARRAMNDSASPECPNGHRQARKLLNAPAVVFRGSGWYVTDSRSKPAHSGQD